MGGSGYATGGSDELWLHSQVGESVRAFNADAEPEWNPGPCEAIAAPFWAFAWLFWCLTWKLFGAPEGER